MEVILSRKKANFFVIHRQMYTSCFFLVQQALLKTSMSRCQPHDQALMKHHNSELLFLNSERKPSCDVGVTFAGLRLFLVARNESVLL